MIGDNRTTFATGLDFSGAAGTVLLGDVIDTEVLGGMNAPMISFNVDIADVAAAGGTSIAFGLATDATEAIDDSSTVLVTTGLIPVADLAAGANVINVQLPAGSAYEQFIGLVVTRVGTFTAGNCNAELLFDAPAQRYFAEGNN